MTPTILPMPAISDLVLDAFVDAVHSYSVGFYHLEQNLFVVQGYDISRGLSQDHWYHLEYLLIDGSIHTACTCPSGVRETCIHRRFFETYQVEMLVSRQVNIKEPSDAIPFLRQPHPDAPGFTTLFSARSLSSSALRGRAIVSHMGVSPTTGIWRCSKDPGLHACAHISRSVKRLEGLASDGDESEQAEGHIEVEDQAQAVERLVRAGSAAVSHLPILPPAWAAIPSDPIMYSRSQPYRKPMSSTIRLGPHSSCPCPSGRTFWDPLGPRIIHTCRVYTLLSFYTLDIELQPCPTCPHSRRRFIGPDLRECGIFNFNNNILVSHELLDEYTSEYTSSETPFVAWVGVMSRRYSLAGQAFMGDDLFRSVWFAYASLMALDGDMGCSHCGPHPETIICDGVTLAFGRKHLKESLRPPTLIPPSSTVRDKVKYQPHQQLLRDSIFRKQLRLILNAPLLPKTAVNSRADANGMEDTQGDEVDDEDHEELPPMAQAQDRAADLVRQHITRIDVVSNGLKVLCPELNNLFIDYFGVASYADRCIVPPNIRNLFRQLSAEESVLQMINRTALDKLEQLISNPTIFNRTDLLAIPALYKVILTEGDLPRFFPILRWLAQATRATLNALLVETPLPDMSGPLPSEPGDWVKTGSLYSMPQIRTRPRYPKLRTDQQQDKSGKRGDRCGKYFELYGKKRLTGGIMVMWCTHSICYGFHTIAANEGRDDVFSAIITHWPKAPRRIVYDFACALGPYSMLREPEFFADTFFAIDHFHSTGHSKCSPAAFLSEYANIDPRLVQINSSAAECGNGGLNRIRKSVSYMSQDRAIIFTKVFLSIWNRLRICQM
ncbi:hypothetical protein BKA70DRAFT_1497346 [Coprinopsis sp. MPI-PUGE-AT-0042]|nr:hypothetical protein BKA70DRAFT_1497346 [Coprinopsis sp. MPI-PUGE-AT-0042]